jgi:hypothetical protein
LMSVGLPQPRTVEAFVWLSVSRAYSCAPGVAVAGYPSQNGLRPAAV